MLNEEGQKFEFAAGTSSQMSKDEKVDSPLHAEVKGPTVPTVCDPKVKKSSLGFVVRWSPPEPECVSETCVQAFLEGQTFEEVHRVKKGDNVFYFKPADPVKEYSFEVWHCGIDGAFGDKTTTEPIRTCIEVESGLFCDPDSPLRHGYSVFSGFLKRGTAPVKSVAVKIFSTGELEQVQHEVALMMKVMDHPNTVSYSMSGKTVGISNKIYIAMELCATETLNEIVKSGWHGNEYCKTVLLQIAHGLCYMHNKGVSHRDLKPQNVLLALDGRNIKISDFGLSKLVDAQKSAVSKGPRIIGTDGWRSPESYYSGGRMSKKSDIFSVGLVFFFVLSGGERVYDNRPNRWGMNIEDNISKVRSGLKCQDAEVAEKLLKDMLEQDPEKRPDCQAILAHPFFWSAEKKLQFCSDAYSHFSFDGDEATCTTDASFQALGQDWMSRLKDSPEDRLIYNTAIRRKGGRNENPASTTGLLRFIRNCHRHHGENKLFRSLALAWRFFSSRFPTLLCEVYRQAEPAKQSEDMQHYFTEAKNRPLPEPLDGEIEISESGGSHQERVMTLKGHKIVIPSNAYGDILGVRIRDPEPADGYLAITPKFVFESALLPSAEVTIMLCLTCAADEDIEEEISVYKLENSGCTPVKGLNLPDEDCLQLQVSLESSFQLYIPHKSISKVNFQISGELYVNEFEELVPAFSIVNGSVLRDSGTAQHNRNILHFNTITVKYGDRFEVKLYRFGRTEILSSLQYAVSVAESVAKFTTYDTEILLPARPTETSQDDCFLTCDILINGEQVESQDFNHA